MEVEAELYEDGADGEDAAGGQDRVALPAEEGDVGRVGDAGGVGVMERGEGWMHGRCGTRDAGYTERALEGRREMHRWRGGVGHGAWGAHPRTHEAKTVARSGALPVAHAAASAAAAVAATMAPPWDMDSSPDASGRLGLLMRSMSTSNSWFCKPSRGVPSTRSMDQGAGPG